MGTTSTVDDSALKREIQAEYRFCAYRLAVLDSNPRPEPVLVEAVLHRMGTIRERFPRFMEGLIV